MSPNLLARLPSFFEKRPTIVQPNVDFSDYSLLPAINCSVLKQRTPKEMLHVMTEPGEETEALRMGSALHAAYLEPDAYRSSLLILPDDAPKKPTKAQREAKKPSKKAVESIEWWNAWNARAVNRRVLNREQADEIEQMCAAIRSHHLARQMLEAPGYNEVTLETWDDESEVMRKVRFDRLPGKGASFILDIKTTCRQLTPWQIRSQILSLQYHLQARWYLETLELATGETRPQFFFIYVTTEAPFMCRVFELQRSDIWPATELVNERKAMFCKAARECMQQIDEHRSAPMTAWEGYENESSVLLNLGQHVAS